MCIMPNHFFIVETILYINHYCGTGFSIIATVLCCVAAVLCYVMFCCVVFITAVTDSEKGDALLVLCEEELLAFDLKTTRCVYTCRCYVRNVMVTMCCSFPEIQKPYLHSIHSSPVTVVQVYENCSRHLYEKFLELGSAKHESTSSVSVYDVCRLLPFLYFLLLSLYLCHCVTKCLLPAVACHGGLYQDHGATILHSAHHRVSFTICICSIYFCSSS